MSSIPLSNIQEVIEITVFEAIRLELVDKGYLPDITQFPDTPQGVTDYNNAIKDIVDEKGFAIDIFNNGSNFNKGIKTIPRIIINSGNFLGGSLGGDPSKFFINNGSNYTAMVTPPQTSDFYLDVHCVSNNVKQERILNSILSLALPKRKYLKCYNDLTKSFFIRYLSFFELDNLGHGLSEKCFSYEIPDCWDTEDTTIPGTISKISVIEMDLRLQKYITGTWGEVSQVSNTIITSSDSEILSSGSSMVTLDETSTTVFNP